jgi:Amt family ammonium transporter
MGQFLIQLKGMGATIIFAGALTYVICLFVEKTFKFRASPEDEKAGLDHALHGEHGYGLLNLN